MKRVLLTGGSGFVGRNVKGYLSTVCELYTPHRQELNLLNEEEVREYLKKNRIDIIIHSANPNPVKNPLDKAETMFEDSIRVFFNLYHSQDLYERMYTLGSGAEYGKSEDISLIQEHEIGRFIPKDSYGLMKYTINKLIEQSNKQCNLRIFACYGPTDHESKFITHVINCCIENKDITIRQNCYFDYMHVSDFAKILEYFIYNTPKYTSYNVCTGVRYTLEDIAKIVRDQMKKDNDIVILKEGWNKEYTGNNKRLLSEIGDYQFINLEEGIKMQIASEKGERMDET